MRRQSWNAFVQDHGGRSGKFLQSWEWGEFQRAAGESLRRKVYRDDGKIVGVGQWLDRSAGALGTYSFCPKGPLGAWQPRESDQMFLRVEAGDTDLSQYAHKTIDLNPAHTLLADLSLSQEDLLAAMHHKTRYNIRLAGRRKVHIHLRSTDIEGAWRLFEQTAARGKFRLHPKDYYETMLSSLSKGDCRAFLATATFEHQVIAATIMIDFAGTRTYLHGASGDAHRSLMAPYLLHWELMKDAQDHGLSWYDWWGVAPEGVKRHSWAGISRFKRGFGGEEVVSPGTYDLIQKPFQYALYRSARFLRRLF